MKPKRIFITGTGTDVGKTFIAGALIHGLLPKQTVRYFKPVQTGYPDSDTEHLKSTLPASEKLGFTEPIYTFTLPASPDQAAEAEQKPYPSSDLIRGTLRGLDSEINLIEGAGGLFVPLSSGNDTWLSLLAEENLHAPLPVLLIATSGLGTINHTLLSVEALRRRNVPVIGVVLSGVIHAANHATITRMLPEIPVWSFDHLPDSESEAFRLASVCLADFVTDGLARLELQKNHSYADVVKKHIWFPYSQHKTMADPLKITQAKGIWLTLEDGRKVVDGISSWWVNNVGHGRQEIADAIFQQQQSVDHTIFAGVWHEPAAKLAKNLLEVGHPDLSRVFYSDNGSTALEVALKIAFQSFTNRGENGRTLFLSLSGSYHGDTFGAMSVSDSSGFHGHFKPLMFSTKTVSPATSHISAFCPHGIGDLQKRLDEFDHQFDKNLAILAGVVVEPLVMGAAGMLMQPPAYLRHIAKRCRENGIPLIVDEVFTGFGRTGSWFAYQRAGIVPDIVACAKGLTGGTIPLAATIAREEFFQAFLSESKQKALMHGHSYTANPIGCAAANAAIDIVRKENIPESALQMERIYTRWIEEHAPRLKLEQARALGGILAFELPGSGKSNYFHDKADAGARTGAGAGTVSMTMVAIEEGILLRPLGNTVYFMPPLCISSADLDFALSRLNRIIEKV